MTIKSRWTVEVPRCSLQQWIFGSANGPLPDKKAFLDPEDPDNSFLTLADYRLLAKRVGLGLQSAGLRPGDRVLLFSGNTLTFPSFFLGVLMAGGIFTGANPFFVTRELAYQLRDSGASFLVSAEDSLDTALEAAEEVGLAKDRVLLFDGACKVHDDRPAPGPDGRQSGCRHWTELLAGNLRQAAGWAWPEPADPETTSCCLNYSSGTTGVPKGVEISHHSYVANGVGVVSLSRRGEEFEEFRARQRYLCFLPMYHAYAQSYFVANLPHMQMPIYVMPGFDFIKMLEHIQRFRITALTAVPPIVVALAKHPAAKEYDLSSLEAVGSGAAPLGREAIENLERRLESGVPVRQGWGMTEVTCTCMSWDPLTEAPSTDGGVGELNPNCQARIVTLDGRREITEPGVAGELWVTGPTLMRGYWRRPEATAATLHVDPADGTRWLKTGDIAYVAGTYGPGAIFHIVDRLKELIKVKGNQVAPAELEAVLLERPDVADAAVIGVTVRGEELPRAYVVLADEAVDSTKPDDITRWMDTKVAKYKRLRGGVVFVDYIPKNPSGKILRKELRERAREEVGDSKPKESKLS